MQCIGQAQVSRPRGNYLITSGNFRRRTGFFDGPFVHSSTDVLIHLMRISLIIKVKESIPRPVNNLDVCSRRGT